MQVIDKIIANFTSNKSLYIGEKVTMSEHMIQTAMLAEKAKCDDNLICSSLLHDYGHFVIEDPNQLVTDKVDGRHEIIGANYLKNFFHNKIIEPILLHVEAKKYLSRTVSINFRNTNITMTVIIADIDQSISVNSPWDLTSFN